jgi:malate dehydrogenase (oxaloacetate-decarboxylating)(NADP+)
LPRRATKSSAIPRGLVATARGNLVAVVTSGTAVLGLVRSDRSPRSMHGRQGGAVQDSRARLLRHRNQRARPDKLVDIVALEPTFGGINLEDIKAPECFYIEQKCRERMKIRCFTTTTRHRDHRRRRDPEQAARRRQGPGRGEARVLRRRRRRAACLDLLVDSASRENIWVADIEAWCTRPRLKLMDDRKTSTRRSARYTLAEILPGANFLIAARVLKPEWLAQMAKSPLILALANPEPEIMPDVAKAAAGRRHRHRPLRFSEPGELRPVLPVHLPRRARRRRHRDQRGDEARACARSPTSRWPSSRTSSRTRTTSRTRFGQNT